MTATSSAGIIPILSLVVAILAVFFGPLVARANLQRQLQVGAREAWMREFREQVAIFLAWQQELHEVGRDLAQGRRAIDQMSQATARINAEIRHIESDPPPDATERLKDLVRTLSSDTDALRDLQDTRLPNLEKRLAYVGEKLNPAFQTINLLIAERGWQGTDFIERLGEFLAIPAVVEDPSEAQKHSYAVHRAAAEILRRERAAIETDRAIRWQPWLQLKAWFARDPPHWPN